MRWDRWKVSEATHAELMVHAEKCGELAFGTREETKCHISECEQDFDLDRRLTRLSVCLGKCLQPMQKDKKMASTHKDPVLVVLELTGANDYLNTIVPYSNPLYWDNRPKVHIAEDQLLPIDDELAFRSDTEPLKDIYDKGNMAIIHGIGFENSPRSHFRAMDIWHTCEPDSIGINGWLAKVIRDLDPVGENVLKGVSLGQGLPRALTMRGVPVTSVNHLPTYGVLSSNPGIASEQERIQILESFARMYAPAIGTGTDYGLPGTGRTGCVEEEPTSSGLLPKPILQT